jgi:hypothetical protein
VTRPSTQAIEDEVREAMAIPSGDELAPIAERIEAGLSERGFVVRAVGEPSQAEQEREGAYFVGRMFLGFGLFILAAFGLAIVAGLLGLHW